MQDEKTETQDNIENREVLETQNITGQGEQTESVAASGKPHHRSRMGAGIAIGVLATLAVVCVAGLVFLKATGSTLVLMSAAGSEVLDPEAAAKISTLAAYIDAYYYDDVDVETLQDGLYDGLLDSLGDKYSVYYTAEEYADMQVSTTGQYYGIGAGLTQDLDTMVVTVSKVYAGTPSEEAGMMAGDMILSVDGVDATSMEVSDLVQLIRGEEGTTVHIEIYRESDDSYLSLDVERRNVTLPSVEYEMLENNIGYIYLESFETETATQFEEAVADLQGQGMESMIIDVRYNGGGLVSSVVQILDDILPEGLLVYIEDKNGERVEYTSDGDTYLDYPLVVLVNESSASASEIFAGAIKDYGWGTLVGTTTFGKGIVQTVFPLDDGDAVKLTTAKYFTPNGNYIHGVGIDPDVELEYEYLDPDGETYEKQYDNQILKAIEILDGGE